MRKNIIIFYYIICFIAIGWAQKVFALTLIPNCDGNNCPYRVNYIKLSDANNLNNTAKDSDTSLMARERILSTLVGNKEFVSMFVTTSKLEIVWDISKIDKKYANKGDIVYLLSYGCSKTPDINNQDGTIRNLPYNSLYWEIPKGDCSKINYCKIWISVRDTSVKDKYGNYKKIAGANTRPFLVCPGQPEIKPPTLYTQLAKSVTSIDPKTKKEIARKFVFNGKLLDLGNDTAVTTTFSLFTQKSLLAINPSKISIGQTSRKIYLKGNINYSYSVNGLSIGDGWCYRIEGQNKYINLDNKPEWVSGGTRCYPDDEKRIIKPYINEKDLIINYKQQEEKIGGGNVRKYISIDGRLVVTDNTIGHSKNAKAFLYIGSVVNLTDANGKSYQKISYNLYKFNEQKNTGDGINSGVYTFSNINISSDDFSCKIVVINEDGKNFITKNIYTSPTKIEKTDINFNQGSIPKISGKIFDQRQNEKYMNAKGYYVKFERLSDIDLTANGYCPKYFYSSYWSLDNVKDDFIIDGWYSFNIFSNKFRYDIADSNEENNLHLCKFEPYTKYKVTLFLDMKQIGVAPRESESETISFQSQKPEVEGVVLASKDISVGKSRFEIKTIIKNNKGNVQAKLIYKALPLGPDGSCDFFDNGNNQEGYDGKAILIVKSYTFGSGSDEHMIIVPYAGRKYCVVLSMQLLDSHNDPIGEPFEYYRNSELISPALPPVVEISDINDSDKTWGGARITAKLISSGVQSDNNNDGKVDGEALSSHLTFAWKYSFSNKFTEFKNQLASDKRDLFENESRTLEFSQFETPNLPSDFKLSDNDICVTIFARNIAGIDNINTGTQKCFKSYFKPEIEAVNAYTLGEDKIIFKNKILKYGNAKKFNINILIRQHPLIKKNCTFSGEISIPIKYEDLIKDGDAFIYKAPSLLDLMVKNSKGVISYITAKKMQETSCSFVFGFSISIEGIREDETTRDRTESEKMIPFGINTFGARIPVEYQQGDFACLAKNGCSTTVYMDLMHFWYVNNKNVRTAYNRFVGETNDTTDRFTANNFLIKFYGNRCAYCSAGSVLGTLRSASIPLNYEPIGSGLSNISGNISDTKSYKIREDLLRQIYEKALAKGYPVVVRTMRDGSQHFFVVKGMLFNTEDGLPKRDSEGKIILNDNDKIYIIDTFNNNHSAIKKDDKINGWYIYKKDFLGIYRCLTTEEQKGYLSGVSPFAYYLEPE